jgi:hypothetical protein
MRNNINLGTGANKNRVIVDIAAGFQCRAIRVDNNNLTNAGGTADRLRRNNGGTAVDVDPHGLETLNIDCKDREEALQVATLLQHKDVVKGANT